MKKLVVCDTVRESRNIFMTHVLPHPQTDVDGHFGPAHIDTYNSPVASMPADDAIDTPDMLISTVTFFPQATDSAVCLPDTPGDVIPPDICFTDDSSNQPASGPGPPLTTPSAAQRCILLESSPNSSQLPIDPNLCLAPDSQAFARSPSLGYDEYDDFHPIIGNNSGRKPLDLTLPRYTLIEDLVEPRHLFPNRSVIISEDGSSKFIDISNHAAILEIADVPEASSSSRTERHVCD